MCEPVTAGVILTGIVGGAIAGSALASDRETKADPVSTPAAEPQAGAAPTLMDPSPTETAAQKLARLRTLRGGIAQTVKSSPLGVKEDSSQARVQTPGLFEADKTKLGQ